MEQLEYIAVGIALSGLLSAGLAILAPDRVFRLAIDRPTLMGFGLALVAIGFAVATIADPW